jgi:hypothetical protein
MGIDVSRSSWYQLVSSGTYWKGLAGLVEEEMHLFKEMRLLYARGRIRRSMTSEEATLE